MKPRIKPAILNIMVFIPAIIMGGCASTKNVGDAATDAANTIVSQPFKDLGLIKKSVPPALAQITDPYATPDAVDCSWLEYQLASLEEVLGPDPVKVAYKEKNMTESGTEIAKSAASDAIKSTATGIIPARGIIRKISGADKSDKEFRNAVELGKVRRGYLTGIAVTKGCFDKK